MGEFNMLWVLSMISNCPILSDEFLVIKDPTLLPTTNADPASYDAGDPRDIGRPSTIDDICDFLLEYMQSDVMVCPSCCRSLMRSLTCIQGLVADQHLKIAGEYSLTHFCAFFNSSCI